MGDWQQLISLGIVAVSAALLVRNQLRKRKRARLNPCDSGCGCTPSAPPDKKLVGRGT